MASHRLATTTILALILATAYLAYINMALDESLGNLSLTASSHINLLGSIPKDHVPTSHNGRRLIVVGDIHGMSSCLSQLLDEVSFDPATDHLVATGDMINKGPDSAGVIDKLMELNASAVRGNHEDHVLKAREKLDTEREGRK
jgi:bis(5'-nucleosyl)-tetraphosphatase (symmetrical)